MMRLVLAASVLALAAAGHATPHSTSPDVHAKPKVAVPARTVRAMIVSGDGQNAHAYIANGKKSYETEFSAALVVRVPAPPPRKGERHVRFTCITKDCTFAPTDQPDKGEWVERVPAVDNAYEATIHNGVAALRVTVVCPVLGAYAVRADPVVQRGERAEPATFTLTAR